MKTLMHKDVQSANIHAEQLNFLLQTIFEHHENFDSQQLKALIGLSYDLAGNIYDWTNEEERIVHEIEQKDFRNAHRPNR